ncbi:MAG: anaerobic ribonucleoside-triphosphate reductase activating protein [Hadesarchaea archaeon]|nr:anaerobic ribonucleoside-triphosphate reductase activating protein [Hadesarchaea archaeon]
MEFKGFQKISLLDYPKKIAAIAFVGGCNLRCGFCYNRDLVMNPQHVPSIPEDEILKYLELNRSWLDGLVVTGGEPTIHQELPNFLERVKQLKFHTKIDTNGTNPKMLSRLFEKNLVDYVALDIKAPLREERYRMVVGQLEDGMLERIAESVRLLRNSNGIDYEFRTTVIPELGREDLLQIAEHLRGAKLYCLQQFKSNAPHIDERYTNLPAHPWEFLHRMREELAPNFQICKIRGERGWT